MHEDAIQDETLKQNIEKEKLPSSHQIQELTPKEKVEQSSCDSQGRLQFMQIENSVNKRVINLEIQLESPHNHDGPLDRECDKESPEAFYVEKRYCTVCNLEQPFRAKHCKHCDRCIARYDHHCPWIGNNKV